MALLRFVIREIKGRPGRATLTVLSIVIAVAALVSVNVSTETSSHAYQDMYQRATGLAALEVVAEGGGPYDQPIVASLEQVHGVKAAVPSFRQPTTIRYDAGGKPVSVPVNLKGIDPQRDSAVHQLKIEQGQPLKGGSEALVEAGFARALGGAQVDQYITVSTWTGKKRVRIVGLFSSGGQTVVGEGEMVLLPLPTVQAFFKHPEEITVTSIVLADGADEQQVQAAIQEKLPPGLIARSPAFRTRMARETLKEVDRGLTYASQLSLALAVIMILNTFLMNVGERRKQLAILRAIGTTRRQLIGMLLGESLLMGLVGTAIGCVLGLGGAQLLSVLMAKAQGVTMPRLFITRWPFVWAALLGPGLSMLAMFIPAVIAGRITPVEGMRPVISQESGRLPVMFTMSGLAINVVSGGVLLLSILNYLPIKVAIFAGVVFTTAFVLLVPALLGPASWLAGKALHPLLHFEGELARRQVLRRRARTTLTVGILYVAVSSGIGLGTTMTNVVDDVRRWHAQTFYGDFVIQATENAKKGGADLPESMGDELRRAIPGIANIDTLTPIRDVTVSVGKATGVENEEVTVVVRGFTGAGSLHLDLRDGDSEDVRNRLFAGEVVAGSVLLQKTGKKVGDQLSINTRQGPRDFRICGMVTDYMFGGMLVFMERSTAKRALGVEGVGWFIIQAAPAVQADPAALASLEEQLRLVTTRDGLILHSLTDLRQKLEEIMNGVIAGLWGLLALGFVVAAFGIANTLTMNVLEQTRDLAMLRVVALTRAQVRKSIFGQAAVIGAIGLVTGGLGGLSGAYITNLCTWAVMGHSVDFAFHPGLVGACIGAGLVLVVLAALLPAERAARLNLLIALQYE
jgi:putative ABC transport system permease protein